MELQKAELAWGKGLVPIQPLQGEGPQPGLWCQAQEMPAPPHRAFPHLKKRPFPCSLFPGWVLSASPDAVHTLHPSHPPTKRFLSPYELQPGWQRGHSALITHFLLGELQLLSTQHLCNPGWGLHTCLCCPPGPAPKSSKDPAGRLKCFPSIFPYSVVT